MTVKLTCLAMLGVLMLTGGPRAAQPPARAPLQLLKISSGPAGTESNGTFVFTEERTRFSRIRDKEIIVMFMWDGTAGPHKLVANWRSPDGNLSSSSAIDYVAKERRFGAYWRLMLSPNVPTGTWTLEATVDGEPGGRFNFEVTDETPAAGVATKKVLTQAQLYDMLGRRFVVLQRSTAVGRQLAPAAGVLGAEGRIYTALGAIEDADVIHVAGAQGPPRAVDSLLGWNRRGGWAVLVGGTLSDPPLAPAAADGVNVGDRCFSMEGGANGVRVLVEGSITGREAGRGGVPAPIATL